jgi:hypothetical protein
MREENSGKVLLYPGICLEVLKDITDTSVKIVVRNGISLIQVTEPFRANLLIHNIILQHYVTLWSSGQSSWLQIRRPGIDYRHFPEKVVDLERGPQPRKYN